MFHKSSTFVEDTNVIVSRIIKLNSKLVDLGREYIHDKKLFPRSKTSVICTKCEGYGHEFYQCPNLDASSMTHENLKDYVIYLKEVERIVVQKVEVLNKVR